jgi:CubicO group peptidase (beta-lactamase class C family)
VVEEYNDWDPTATHNSWSMAKSINSALIGILVGEGRIDPWAPVGAPEWSEPDDPRAAITLDELLRMSSGLQWDESYTDPNGDVLASLGPDNDRAHFTASKPLESEPGSTWEYSSGTANLIARSVAEQVGYGDDLTSWIDTALFRPLGINQVEHLVDEAGVISGGSWINLTPRDFARFGLLYARNGIWDGTRLLPDGWVDYSRMPTPSDPDGSFYASGFSGQSITVVPERDLVVVVLSDTSDDRDEQTRQGLLDVFGA